MTDDPTDRRPTNDGPVIHRPVVGYLRVSTDAQAERGSGLDTQRDVIARWAADQGLVVDYWCSDPGVSGDTIPADRDGFAEAWGHLARGGSLVVYRMDRLARNLVYQEMTLRELDSSDVQVWSASEPSANGDRDDPDRELVRRIMAAIAEHERAWIRRRMDAGRERKRLERGWLGGHVPYGMRRPPHAQGHLEPHPDTWPVVLQVQAWHEGGMAVAKIARELTALGIPTPSGGDGWGESSVRKIVKRTVDPDLPWPPDGVPASGPVPLLEMEPAEVAKRSTLPEAEIPRWIERWVGM